MREWGFSSWQSHFKSDPPSVWSKE